jgi:alcohol dehydrogenase YqhD (iron-dependent ADH family)
MMNNFNLHPYTQIIFGTKELETFFKSIQQRDYSNILLVYGYSSIKKMGLYDKVIEQLDNINANYEELKEVDPNPRLSTVRKGIQICKDQNIDFILAIGGGSTIDCAKAIAVGAANDDDIWDIMYYGKRISAALPTGNILTLSATGSETNGGFVITNEETNDKLGYRSDITRPQITLLDPTNTYSVTAYQTAAGSIDILAHVLEQYFSSEEESFVTDRILEGIAKAVIHFTSKAIEEPQNYDYRSNLMWAGTMALNGLAGAGRSFEGSVHAIEHAISAYYDVTHGVGLAIIYPSYLSYVLSETNVHRYNTFFKEVFGLTDLSDKMAQAKQGIEKLKEFVISLNIPTHLETLGIPFERFSEIAEGCLRARNVKTLGTLRPLQKEDIVEIYKNAY